MVLVYFALWLIMNGRVTLEVAVLGLAASLLLDQFVRRALRIRLSVNLRLLPDALGYAAVLVREVVRANFAMIRMVLAPEIEVEPCLVRFRTGLGTEAARVALANSITLTPGTITVSLKGNELLVHALNHDMARGLSGSPFERLLERMERGAAPEGGASHA